MGGRGNSNETCETPVPVTHVPVEREQGSDAETNTASQQQHAVEAAAKFECQQSRDRAPITTHNDSKGLVQQRMPGTPRSTILNLLSQG